MAALADTQAQGRAEGAVYSPLTVRPELVEPKAVEGQRLVAQTGFDKFSRNGVYIAKPLRKLAENLLRSY